VEIKDLDAAGNVPGIEEAGRTAQANRPVFNAKSTKEHNAAAASKMVDSELAEKIAETMNDITSTLDIRIAFSVDQGSGKRVIKVINNETKEIIRQIPPDEMLALVGQMHRIMGLLLNKVA
jgi:flagellar protein FlaG